MVGATLPTTGALLTTTPPTVHYLTTSLVTISLLTPPPSFSPDSGFPVLDMVHEVMVLLGDDHQQAVARGAASRRATSPILCGPERLQRCPFPWTCTRFVVHDR